MKISLIGPNGSGKSTLAKTLSDILSIPIISAGYILRHPEEFPWIKNIIGSYDVYSGELLDDDLLVKIISRVIEDHTRGWILDGIPRMIPQCQAMLEHFRPSTIIILEAPLDLITERLTHRLYHPASGRVYHSIYAPPLKEGYDDLTGEPLIQRPDDSPETIKKRYDIYQTKTIPMIEYIDAHASDIPIFRIPINENITPVKYGESITAML